MAANVEGLEMMLHEICEIGNIHLYAVGLDARQVENRHLMKYKK